MPHSETTASAIALGLMIYGAACAALCLFTLATWKDPIMKVVLTPADLHAAIQQWLESKHGLTVTAQPMNMVFRDDDGEDATIDEIHIEVRGTSGPRPG